MFNRSLLKLIDYRTNGAVYIRVPATVWNDPTRTPPLKVRQYFQHLYRATT